MRTHRHQCRATRPWQHRPSAAGLLAATIALLAFMPAASSLAQSTATPALGTGGAHPATIEVPANRLDPILSSLPVSDLGLTNAQLGTLLSSLNGGLLGSHGADLSTLVSTLLAGHPSATLGELTSEVLANPVLGLVLTLAHKSLTAEQVLAGLSPEQLSGFLSKLTEAFTPTQLAELIAGLAGTLSPGQLTELQSILTVLTGELPEPALAQLRGDLATLPGLSAGELALQSPEQLAETVDHLFTTATPTQLAPVVGDLLGGLSLSPSTVGSLAPTLGMSTETLTSDLGVPVEEASAGLPVAVGELGHTGKLMGVADGLDKLVLGMLTPESPAAGEGGSGTGGSGAGGTGGSGGSGGPGGGSSGTGTGSNGGSGATGGGGAGAGNTNGPSQSLTVLVSTPSSPAPAPTGSSAGAKPGKLRILSHHVHGRVATIVALAPAAGKIELSGRGVRATSARVSANKQVTLTATLARGTAAMLHRHHRHLAMRLTATLLPTAGGAHPSTTATVTFA